MRGLLMSAAVLGLALSGCTTTSDDGGANGMTQTTTTTTDGTMTDTTTTGETTHQVDIEDFAFSPASLSINVGDTVVWTNSGDLPHTVTSTDGGPLESGSLGSGQSYQFTFDEPGTYAYDCEFHPQMTGSIEVVAPGSGASGV